MQYIFKSDNMQMTPSMEHLAKDKFSKIEARYSDLPEDSVSVKLVMNSEKEDKFSVRADLLVKGKEYFANESGFSLENAVVNVVEELVRMLEKDKDTQRDYQQIREEKELVAEELLDTSTIEE